MPRKVEFLKSTIHEDVMWPAESVTDTMEDGRARYLEGMGWVKWAAPDAPVSPKPASIPIRNNKQDDQEALGKILERAIAKGMTTQALESGFEAAGERLPMDSKGRKVA